MPQRRHLVASAIVVLLLALVPLAGSRYAIDLATEVLIYVLFALSLNVLIGFTGNISFGHAAYFAIGGYACAILLTTYDWPLAASLPAARTTGRPAPAPPSSARTFATASAGGGPAAGAGTSARPPSRAPSRRIRAARSPDTLATASARRATIRSRTP